MKYTALFVFLLSTSCASVQPNQSVDMTGVETKPSGQTPKISNDGPVCAVAMATERDPEQVREQEKWRHESE
ncbi:MAG: hypothetical protein ABIH21_04050, partial [Patescibacteria group bacterium]